MIKLSTRVLPFLALAGAALAQAPQLQVTTSTQRIDAQFAVDVGNSQYGANVAAAGSASMTTSRLGAIPIGVNMRLEDSLVGRVRVDGVNREAAAVTRFAEVGGSLTINTASRSFRAGYTVRVGGNTIFAPAVSVGVAARALTWDDASNTLTIFSVTDWVSTPLFGVNVNVNARARASITATPVLNPQALSASIVGNVRGVGTANANASINLLCAGVGIENDFRLFDTRITPTVTMSYPNGLSGRLAYSCTAFRALGRVFATLCGLSATTTFVNLSSGAIEGAYTYN